MTMLNDQNNRGKIMIEYTIKLNKNEIEYWYLHEQVIEYTIGSKYWYIICKLYLFKCTWFIAKFI